MNLNSILKENNVNLDKENVLIACNGGTLEMSLENKMLKIQVHYVDRVIHVPDINISELQNDLVKGKKFSE